MNGPQITRMDTITGRNEVLTNRAVKRFTFSTSLLCVSTAGREAGSSESASAFNVCELNGASRMVCNCETPNEAEENAKRPIGPRSGQENPTLGANPPIPKKKRPAFAGRRSGDAIPGGVT